MEELTQLLDEYAEVVVVCAIFVVGILGWFIYDTPSRRAYRLRLKRGREMEDTRRAYLLSQVADDVTEGLMKRFLAFEITGKEYVDSLKVIGARLGIKDLLPRNGKESQTILKKEVKHRLNSNKYYRDDDGNRINVIPFPSN